MKGVILSGGRNSRFPYPKGFIEVEGESLLARNVALLRSLVGEVGISTNVPELHFPLGVPLFGDVIDDAGPLGGIFSAFLATGADALLVVACDMPFPNPELMRYIIRKTAGEATVPLWEGRPEPLLAVYTRKTLERMEACLRSGRRSLTGFLRILDVRYIEEPVVRRMDPAGESFVNINTPEDFERVFGRGRKSALAQGG
ncbi:MAG: molybdenum cofactor guanylyltransferase [Nitrospirota bacterium]|jgi:molybdopterin-guanine dinucleotide biosynthesis protein A